MKSKILFVNPTVDTSEYEWERRLGSALAPIGLCSLAAYTRKHGFETEILDAYNLGFSLEVTLTRILESSPTHLGITATTTYVSFAAKLAKLIKKHKPEIATIIGGAHISAMPLETMQKFVDFDIGVIGEGEETIVELLNLPQPFQGMDNIKGIIYREQDGNLKKTAARPYLDDLDKLPYPAWDLLEGFPRYYRPSITNYRKYPVASLVTSRGCPYQCAFCDRSVFGSHYRSFSSKYIVGLIEELKARHDVREICFYDDTFPVDSLKLNTLCEYFIENNLKLSWSCLSRVDLLDSAKLRLMKRAGCWLISYGIESASQGILDLHKKKINLSQIEDTIKVTKEEGIRTRGFFMLGNPLETEDTISRMKNLLRRLPLDDIHISFFTPIPGSELYRFADKYGEFVREWTSMDMYNLNFIPHGLNGNFLLRCRASLYRNFYIRPRRLIYYLLILISPKRFFEIFKKGLLFLKLISIDV